MVVESLVFSVFAYSVCKVNENIQVVVFEPKQRGRLEVDGCGQMDKNHKTVCLKPLGWLWLIVNRPIEGSQMKKGMLHQPVECLLTAPDCAAESRQLGIAVLQQPLMKLFLPRKGFGQGHPYFNRVLFQGYCY